MSVSPFYLLGLDIGSTTTHLMIAEAELLKNCVTGRMEFSSPKVFFKSEPVFTPFTGNEIDLASLSLQISAWLNQSKINSKNLGGGGVIVTGLASKKENATKIKKLVKELVSESIVATAEDPHLESWLAFKGNCQTLSTEKPETSFLNFDIGGGTTNVAVGRAGDVLSTGCLFIGARHFQFDAGTYRLTLLSVYGVRLLKYLKIDKKAGQTLEDSEIKLIVTEYVNTLENIVTGNILPQAEALYDYSSDMQLKIDAKDCVITFSGGVGELLYKGERPNGKSLYGDLGEALAQGILDSKILSRDLRSTVPINQGRATVFGMTLYQVDVSGATTYLSDPALLPMEDIPIVTTIDLSSPEEIILSQTQILCGAGNKVGVYVLCNPETAREQFIRFAKLLKIPKDTSIVFFLENNLGKTLGNYLTDWGKSKLNCIVIDEVPLKSAQFASLGRMLQNTIPVSFYGMR